MNRLGGPLGRLLPLGLLLSCAPSTGGAPDPIVRVDPSDLPDPFATPARETFGMTDVGEDLLAVLEQGDLHGSCERLAASPDDRRLERMCGKETFFYDPLDTVGVPRPLVDFLLEHMPDLVGPGFSEFGLIPDPFSAQGLPLGMAPSVDDSVAFTCASCHFGRLPDGRYAVGAPNQEYDYGRHNLALTLVPMSLMGTGSMDPLARAEIQPLLDRLDADLLLKLQLVGTLFQLLGSEVPAFPAETQRLYARWEPGTMDFLIAPLPLDDGVHTISRIPPLWGLPTAAERDAAGIEHAMLGWTGNTPSTEEFVYWFGVLGGGRHPTSSETGPLTAYLESLATPASPGPDGDAFGHEVFVRECLDCHGGPAGSGLTLYDPLDIGTDPAIALWMDPTGSNQPCCNDEVPSDFVTGMLKSPRITGLWAQRRFLHNGSVESLEALVCLEPRRGTTEAAFGDGGHTYGCELPAGERSALLDWLRSR